MARLQFIIKINWIYFWFTINLSQSHLKPWQVQILKRVVTNWLDFKLSGVKSFQYITISSFLKLCQLGRTCSFLKVFKMHHFCNFTAKLHCIGKKANNTTEYIWRYSGALIKNNFLKFRGKRSFTITMTH